MNSKMIKNSYSWCKVKASIIDSDFAMRGNFLYDNRNGKINIKAMERI